MTMNVFLFHIWPHLFLKSGFEIYSQKQNLQYIYKTATLFIFHTFF